MMYKRIDRKPSDSGHDSTCTADGCMGSTGDSRKRRMRGGVKREAGQKEEEAAVVPLQRPKKTRGRVKLDNEFIENTLKRRKTFSVRKNGIIKKIDELTKLTGTQVLLLVASETGRVYTFASDKLQPMFTSEAGNALIRSCLDSPQGSPPHKDDDAPTDTGDSRKRRMRGGVKREAGQKEEAAVVASLPGTTTTSAQSNVVPTTTTTVQESSGLQVRGQQHSHAPTSSPPTHKDDDAPTDVSAAAALGFKEKMDFQASESESLGSTNVESKPSFNILPGTISSSSDQSMVPTTSTTTSTVQESSGQQHSHDPAPASSLLPMKGHVMYPSAPHNTVMYNISGLQWTHEELMEFALSMCSADSL